MSLRIGLIVEGAIDGALLPSLIQKILKERCGIHWPVDITDLREFPIRKRGYGGVVERVKGLIRWLSKGAKLAPDKGFTGDSICTLYCVVLDYRGTQSEQREIRRMI